jgi:hypothetical protein
VGFNSALDGLTAGNNLVKQRCDVVINDERLNVCGGEESLGDHVRELLQQRVIKPTGVEQRDGFAVQAELALAHELRKLFECADAAGASDDAARSNCYTHKVK